MGGESEQLLEHLFREESGKLVATLTRLFGATHIELAEDIVQETLIAALNNWSVNGTPENPAGWLVQVAKRKAINELKRKKRSEKHHQERALSSPNEEELQTVFLPGEIRDSQLRMIFTCCHPSISIESQIALTLKTLCGFGVKELANALLTNEATINKRLYRAKLSIQNSASPFDIPQGKELIQRLDAVSLALYLLFNEGYNSSTGNESIRKELCLESIRLAKLLVDHFSEQKQLHALLALMCFHVARFDARMDDKGALILLEDQGRAKWNSHLISEGMGYLNQSAGAKSISSYHLEAGIAAEHCLAKSFETTNWKSIQNFYLLLSQKKPSPVIKLNLAIIQSKLKNLKSSIQLLKELEKENDLKSYFLLPATQGEFYMKAKEYKKAVAYLKKAESLNPPESVMAILKKKLIECKKSLPK